MEETRARAGRVLGSFDPPWAGAERIAAMSPEFLKVTPNLVVADIERSTAYYRDVLGFSVVATVPEQSPFAFVWVKRGEVNIFLNDRATVGEHDPELAKKPIGGSFTIYILMTGVDEFYAQVASRATVLEPLETKFYGMRECLLADPDGYLLTFAEEGAR
jgi:catechol 2,3-dioxygenase-like lactoylglutathione lyase family enzyme